MVQKVLERLKWLGHSSFVYSGPPVIYFDPYGLRDGEAADLILISHHHPHHCSLVDLEKVRRSGTVIVTDKTAARKIEFPVITLEPGEQAMVEGIMIEGVPAYNLTTSFHPKREGHLGFIVTLEGVRVYHAGDTDFIPEMRDFEVDIALLPVTGFSVMTVAEAAQAALALRAQVVIPMHYGAPFGSLADAAESLRGLLAGRIRVEILAKG